ncbi:MAG: hypothetical protein ACXVJ2_15945, partial [Candidatus Angelobacter sp.]
ISMHFLQFGSHHSTFTLLIPSSSSLEWPLGIFTASLQFTSASSFLASSTCPDPIINAIRPPAFTNLNAIARA